MSKEKFQEAINLFKTGNKKQAGELLSEVVESDPGNAEAWYGLALCTDDVGKKKNYLEKVLEINPQHQKAQQSLEKIVTTVINPHLSVNNPQEKKIILENSIAYYVRQGYRVGSQTENSAQLIKPKQFSLLAAIILFLIYIIPFIIYLLYYLAQKDKTVYIVINDEGKISVTDEKGQLRIVENVEQLAPVTYKSIPAEKDPGYTNSTKIMLAVLAVVFIIAFIIMFVNQ